jgi:hypothetical protein
MAAADKAGLPSDAPFREALREHVELDRRWRCRTRTRGRTPSCIRFAKFRCGPGKDWLNIIGIAKDVKVRQLREPPQAFLYLPLLQDYRSNMTLVARAAMNPKELFHAIQTEVASIDAEMPIFDVKTLEEHLGVSCSWNGWPRRCSAFSVCWRSCWPRLDSTASWRMWSASAPAKWVFASRSGHSRRICFNAEI